MDLEALKQQAAERVVAQVRSGMVVGLGTGSTAHHFLQALAGRMRNEDLRITGVPTSSRTAAAAADMGIPLATLEQQPRLDLAVDGVDEIDADLNLIKGAGGALLRERLVEACAERFIVIADETKRVDKLGKNCPVPVEVIRFGWKTTALRIEAIGGQPVQRCVNSESFITDEWHYILDCQFDSIGDVPSLANKIKCLAGVVDHGLFVDMADQAIIAGSHGVEVIERKR